MCVFQSWKICSIEKKKAADEYIGKSRHVNK